MDDKKNYQKIIILCLVIYLIILLYLVINFSIVCLIIPLP